MNLATTLNRPVPVGTAALMLLGGLLLGIAAEKHKHPPTTSLVGPEPGLAVLQPHGQPWTAEVVPAKAPFPMGTTVEVLSDNGRPIYKGDVYFRVTYPADKPLSVTYRRAVVGVALNCEKKTVAAPYVNWFGYAFGDEHASIFDDVRTLNMSDAPELDSVTQYVTPDMIAKACS
ncbi:hypothetical protein [Burkholderia pseudomallei]|uniref:hypothetical protein n=1 Tax=Burkholderia pseudomallei TaxID=28450 RepID=UPI0011781E03|nr:hypothetical protein [Burkholderia pseudomallei]